MKNLHLLRHIPAMAWKIMGGVVLGFLWLCCMFISSSDLVANGPVFIPTIIIVTANVLLLILLIQLVIYESQKKLKQKNKGPILT
jgi:hypothetical protein